MKNRKEPIEMYYDGEITVEEYIRLVDERIKEILKDSEIRRAAEKVEKIKKDMEKYKNMETPKKIKITWCWPKWWRKAEKKADADKEERNVEYDNVDDLLKSE